MAAVKRLTALALARALLAGEPRADGMAARLKACLGQDAPWLQALAERCARLPGEHWRRLTPRTLADLIERDAGYQQAWQHGQTLQVRCYFLFEATGMNPLPLGLDHCQRPAWPHTAALAQWLDIPDAGLWRLTHPADRQRRAPLVEQHYRYELRAKRSGGWRLLEVPQPHLLALQRRLLDGLLTGVPPHEAACGYTPGRSVLDHARAHTGQAVVLKFDLLDFFSRVPASQVHALFTTLGYPATVASSLTALCTTATPEPVLRRLFEAGGLRWDQVQRLRGAHLPQGAPTSPALANLCAFRLDLRLAGLAATLGARYTRYADDIVLSGAQHLARHRPRIEAWVARITREEGYALNHRKSRCLTAGRQQAVCGIVVNQRANLSRLAYDELKATLHQCLLHGPASQNRAGHAHWREHLQGRVAWAAQLNPAKAGKLQRLLGQIDWNC